jgi:hypothetical protein
MLLCRSYLLQPFVNFVCKIRILLSWRWTATDIFIGYVAEKFVSIENWYIRDQILRESINTTMFSFTVLFHKQITVHNYIQIRSKFMWRHKLETKKKYGTQALEPVFLNVYGAPELFPRNEFRECAPTVFTNFWIEPVFVNPIYSPGIDSQHGSRVQQPYLSYRPARAVIFKESMGVRNRGGREYRTSPPGYIDWRNSLLGIDSGAP